MRAPPLPGGTVPACLDLQAGEQTPAEAKEIYAKEGRQQEMMQAIAAKTIAKGERESATAAQLQDIGKAIKRAILAADSASKTRLLRNTRQISLGSGYGTEATIPLP
jgi:hypothetical protein